MKKMTMSEVKQLMKQMAEDENTTLEQVRQDIADAVRVAMTNPDPDIQAKWRKIAKDGKTPTPEEFMLYMINHGEEIM